MLYKMTLELTVYKRAQRMRGCPPKLCKSSNFKRLALLLEIQILPNVLYKMTLELTFENFCQHAQRMRGCPHKLRKSWNLKRRAVLFVRGYSEFTLQHTAAHCNTLQHTATQCNTLQHNATRGTLRAWVR